MSYAWTPQQRRLAEACRTLLREGIKPTATALEKFDPSFVSRKGTNITLSSGRLALTRREVFKEFGWEYVPYPGTRFPESNGRWLPPKERDARD